MLAALERAALVRADDLVLETLEEKLAAAFGVTEDIVRAALEGFAGER